MSREISSLQHPLVKHLVSLRLDKRYRQEQGRLLLVGARAIAEVCSQIAPKRLLVTPAIAVPPGVQPDELVEITEQICQKVAGVQQPEGIVAELEIPSQRDVGACQRLLILDGISDPGNMGTLLRTALAFGWEGVYITDKSVDPFNDKVLRATRGALFRLPYTIGSWNYLETLLAKHPRHLFVADLYGQPAAAGLAQPPLALILSNEAHGPSKQALDRASPVTIPMSSSMESLNVAVAGGILMHLLR